MLAGRGIDAMTIETLTFVTESGMTTIAVTVPDFDGEEARRAWADGAGAGATAMWDALHPEAPPHVTADFGQASRTATLDSAVDEAAEAILRRAANPGEAGGDWPVDIDDARGIARTVLDALGWRTIDPPTQF